METLDAETSPWPLVRGSVLAFLRHDLSDYDERLRRRCERDPKFRDELAAEVAAQAFRKYPWLRDDPRPFPDFEKSEKESVLPFDEISKELADLYTLRDHLLSAIRDLRRQGNHSEEIAQLQTELRKIQHDINCAYDFLSAPKTMPEQGKTRSFVTVHPKEEGVEPRYHFYSGKELTPNRIQFIGFRCPQCGVPVARWKQIVAFGQGYRCVIYACHHLTCAIHTPGGPSRLKAMTLEDWVGFHP
jgi:predicted RNA-binding Zn-ribbon protein involved in translation (DUF1610 family)